jgi:predicted nucleic acid-binding protein
MKAFLDTSVLVAAFRGGHVHHLPSLKRFVAAEKGILPAVFIRLPKFTRS